MRAYQGENISNSPSYPTPPLENKPGTLRAPTVSLYINTIKHQCLFWPKAGGATCIYTLSYCLCRHFKTLPFFRSDISVIFFLKVAAKKCENLVIRHETVSLAKNGAIGIWYYSSRPVMSYVNHDVTIDLIYCHCCSLHAGTYFVHLRSPIRPFPAIINYSACRCHGPWRLRLPTEPKISTVVLHYISACKEPQNKPNNLLYARTSACKEAPTKITYLCIHPTMLQSVSCQKRANDRNNVR